MANEVVSTYDFDVSKALANLKDFSVGLKDIRRDLLELSDNPFKEATQGAGQLEKELTGATREMAKADAVAAAYKEEVKKLNAELQSHSKQLKALSAAAKYKEDTKQVAALKEELKKANQELKNMQREGTKATSILSRIKGGFLGAISGSMTGGGAATQTIGAVLGAVNPALGVAAGLLGSLAEKAFNATAQWQGYSVALKSSLGSQELANTNLSVLEELAVRLPIALNEATEGFQQLVNRGFKPTKDELSNLSGFAAAQNKSFDQLIQAILDAEQGELERLKEFGIQASNEGGKVSVTFRGITKTFEKGARDSATAFADLARELGSDKLNAEKMETLAGRMSNLGDQTDRIARRFGEILLPVFESVLDITGKVLDKVDSSISGWMDFDKVLADVSKTSGENAYPTLKKLLDLFSSNEEGRDRWADFFFNLNAGFERLINMAELLVNVMSNLTDPSEIAKALGRFGMNDENINKAVRSYYSTDQTKKPSGDFVYGPDGGGGPRPPDTAAIKLAEKRARDLAEMERKLSDELLKIQNEYGKERLESLKDQELLYIEEKRKYDLLQIDQEQKALLRLKQLVSGARKGNYDANGKVIADQSATLTDQEKAPFDFRRNLVDQQAFKEQADFINKAEKEITAAISNEYQKQLQAAEYKYEELIRLARKAGVDTVKIEKEKEKEIARINTDKALSDLEKKSLQEQGDAELNIIRAQIEGRTGVEIQARQGLLEIEKKYLLEKIQIIEKSGDEEADARIRAIKKTIGEIDKSIADLGQQEKDRKGAAKFLADTLGMNDHDIAEAVSAAETFSSQMQSIMSDLYSSLNRMSEQRIQRINDEIRKKEDQVEKERELNEEGTANNLSLRLKELADLKEARERALEDQKRLQRTQLIVDTASQASSMITAASKVFTGFATIPIVGVGLGIAAVALMLGAFAAAKIKAFQLVNQQPAQFKHGGRHKGKLHSEGGEIVEVERDEWTINRESSMRYDKLLEAVNNDDRDGIMDYLLKDLLSGAGVSMNDMERKRDMKIMSDFRKSTDEYGSQTVEELRKMRAELAEVKEYTARIPRFQSTPLGDGVILKEDTQTGSKQVVDYTDMIE